MSALTYLDYLWIALFVIGLWYGDKIVWVLVCAMIDSYLKKKRFTPRPMNTLDLLESSHRFEVTIGEVEKDLQDDVEQGLIISYTIGDYFIVYRKKSGLKGPIDLSRYDVE